MKRLRKTLCILQRVIKWSGRQTKAVIIFSVLFSSCKEKIDYAISNIDSIVLRKPHRDDVFMYHYDSVVVKDKEIFDTIYNFYLSDAKSLKGSLIKLPTNDYLMNVYKSDEPNDTIVVSKKYIYIEGKKTDLLGLDRDIVPFLDRVFKQRFSDTNYCHVKRLEQDSLQPRVYVE